jgi:uroporphyrinogen decarboxylase
MGNGNIFESSWYMTGFEDMFLLLMTDPELANRLLEKVAGFFAAYFERALTAAEGLIDIVFTADDIGQQSGLLMSLPMWEEILKPHHVRLNRLLHQFGVKVMYHTDGAIMDAADVREEVRRRVRVLGEQGGYILAPSHAIQGGTPPENIIAFLEEAGRYPVEYKE